MTVTLGVILAYNGQNMPILGQNLALCDYYAPRDRINSTLTGPNVVADLLGHV